MSCKPKSFNPNGFFHTNPAVLCQVEEVGKVHVGPIVDGQMDKNCTKVAQDCTKLPKIAQGRARLFKVHVCTRLYNVYPFAFLETHLTENSQTAVKVIEEKPSYNWTPRL